MVNMYKKIGKKLAHIMKLSKYMKICNTKYTFLIKCLFCIYFWYDYLFPKRFVCDIIKTKMIKTA